MEMRGKFPSITAIRVAPNPFIQSSLIASPFTGRFHPTMAHEREPSVGAMEQDFSGLRLAQYGDSMYLSITIRVPKSD
jgi:hypothetical protein